VQDRFSLPVILITHDPEDVAALAQTVVVCDAGKIRRVMALPDQDKQRAAAGLLSSVAL
jgi:ABC-type sulfate/molybdate transport systems ATPase subunit